MPMEALYAKLYEKYSKLKRKKLSELYEINKEQEEKFVNFTSEVLIQHLRTENKKLQGIVDKFKNETTSIRSIKEKEFVEYQRLLMEEEKKNKALSEEVKNLKELFQERQHLCGSSQDSETPDSTQITTTRTNKRSRQSKDIIERDMISPQVSHHNKVTECCKTNHDTSGGLCDCIFQALGEQLLGMKLATSKQGGQVCIIALHPSSGLSFSLTLVKNLISEEESELLYKIVSLGTFDRVAPEWMREVVMFSTSMCPVFFERVSRVIRLHC